MDFGKTKTGILAHVGNTLLKWLVDSNAQKAGVIIIWPGSDVNMTLVSPSGEIFGPDSANVTEYAKSNDTIYYLIDNPEPGEWTAEIDPVNISESGEPYTFSTFFNHSVSMNVWTNQPTGYSAGDNPAIYAQITDGSQPIPGATVWADVQYPDQSLQTVALYDDGTHGDATAGDGTYTSSVSLPQSGIYQITVSTNGTSTDQFERTAFLSFSTTPLTAGFTATPTSGTTPLTVQLLR